jgi:hypothetical protein
LAGFSLNGVAFFFVRRRQLNLEHRNRVVEDFIAQANTDAGLRIFNQEAAEHVCPSSVMSEIACSTIAIALLPVSLRLAKELRISIASSSGFYSPALAPRRCISSPRIG